MAAWCPRPAWLLALLALTACARALVAPAQTPVAVGTVQAGQASWYGAPYHGRRTAGGEVYDMHDLTAAHRTLPLGTRVLVTNLDSGEAVEVRINDRGPFAEERILDLSYGAARLLGAVGPGVIPVRLRVIDLPGGSPAGPGPPRLTIQVGAFTTRERAEALRQALERQGAEAVIAEAVVGGEIYYRVRVGRYADRPAAQAAARRLAERGYRALIVEQ